jgi:hypothetical protein
MEVEIGTVGCRSRLADDGVFEIVIAGKPSATDLIPVD